MKLYLDDQTEEIRPTPPGWRRCRWPSEVIHHLQTGLVEEISLDHDLGDKDSSVKENRREIKGIDVLTWIQEQVFLTDFVPPKMNVHSDNGPGIRDMRNVIRRIEEIYQEKHEDEIEMAE